MIRRTLLAAVFSGVALGAGSTAALAEFPEKPIRIVVPFAAGGATDAIARVTVQSLSERIGQPVTIDNISGGDMVLGIRDVLHAAPDGYTLLFHTGSLAIDPTYRPSLEYDVREDLIPITKAAWGPFTVLVRPGLGVNSLQELSEYSKAHPGGLNYGSGGTGATIHLAGEYLWKIAQIEAQHIAYRGEGPATAALLAGEIDIQLKPPFTATELVSANQAVALGVTAAQRSALLPDTPTIIELGYEGFVVGHWGGFFAPKGTPEEIVSYLNRELVAALNVPQVKDHFAKSGLIVIADTPEEFRASIIDEIALWERIISEAGIEPQ